MRETSGWRVGGWLAALVAAVAWVTLDPVAALSPDAGVRLARALTAALALLACALGGGAFTLRRRAPALLEGSAPWAWALGAGVALATGAWTLLAVAGAPLGAPVLLGVPLALGALGVYDLARGTLPRVPLPAPGATAWTLGTLALLPGLAEALAPPTDTDEVYQHMDLVRTIVETGALPGGWLHPDGSRPLPAHLLHAAAYLLGGEAAPRVMHLLVAAALARAVQELGDARFGTGRGALPALALLGSTSFVREAGMAYPDHLVAFALLLATEALLRGNVVTMGVFAGLAVAAKYTAGPIAALLFALALLAPREGSTLAQRARACVPAGALALATVAPWWARNLLAGLHPLFPYAGWPEANGAPLVFAWPEKYGVGRSALDFARLPLDVLLRADPGTFVFLGRLNLVWGALLAGAAWTAWRGDATARRLLVLVAGGFGAWAAGPQLLRWLLPLAGIAGLLAAACPPWRPAWALWLLALPSNLTPVWERAATRAAVARGAETREAFLARELPGWGAIQAVEQATPPDAKVAQLYAWHGYHLARPHVLGSVEDHVPTRWWLATHGDDALPALAREGVTHLVVGDLAFFAKAYPFMTPEALDVQLVQPAARLRRLLERDAVRLHAEGRWEVWRLDLDAPRATK